VVTTFAHARKHAFQLFQDDQLAVAEPIRILAAAGDQGLADLHANCQTPFKKSKHHPLPKRQKHRNRNRRKRFALRLNLIAAIYNLELN